MFCLKFVMPVVPTTFRECILPSCYRINWSAGNHPVVPIQPIAIILYFSCSDGSATFRCPVDQPLKWSLQSSWYFHFLVFGKDIVWKFYSFDLWCAFYPLRPCGPIWRQGYWSTLTQVMACCLTAPSHRPITWTDVDLSSVRSQIGPTR